MAEINTEIAAQIIAEQRLYIYSLRKSLEDVQVEIKHARDDYAEAHDEIVRLKIALAEMLEPRAGLIGTQWETSSNTWKVIELSINEEGAGKLHLVDDACDDFAIVPIDKWPEWVEEHQAQKVEDAKRG